MSTATKHKQHKSQIDQYHLNDLSHQLMLAGQVQRDFLPKKLPNTNNHQFSSVFLPADHVSGDIYDIQRLDESHIAFYIADAVGHSMPAAILTMFLKQAIVMRETTGSDYTLFEPSEVLEKLNRKMIEQSLSGCMFATCIYCLFDFKSNTIKFARAGHPYPVLINKHGNEKRLEIRGGLLGVFPGTEFETGTIKMLPGEKLLLFSDGTEPIIGKSDNNNKFEFNKPTLDSFCESGEDIMSLIHKSHREMDIDEAEYDDVTAVCLEILQK